MTYDKDKYSKLRSLEVPRVIALALANDDSPLNAEIAVAGAVADLESDAELTEVVAGFNDLLASLRGAGLLAESEEV